MSERTVRADGMIVVDGIRYKPHEAPRHKAVLAPTGDTGRIAELDEPAVPGEPTKEALLEQLAAAGATNMATLERYGVARLQAELDKLLDG